MKTASERGEKHPPRVPDSPQRSHHAQRLEKPCWLAQGIPNSGQEQRGHHHRYSQVRGSTWRTKKAPCQVMRLGFYSNTTAAAGAPMRCPRLALNRARMQNPKIKNHPAVFRHRKQALLRFRTKPQEKKNVASISEFYQDKLQEYLVC